MILIRRLAIGATTHRRVFGIVILLMSHFLQRRRAAAEIEGHLSPNRSFPRKRHQAAPRTPEPSLFPVATDPRPLVRWFDFRNLCL